MSIKLKQLSVYKSINNLDGIELADFSVITGLNGSGKSQLLEAIKEDGPGLGISDINGRVLRNIKHITHAQLAPNSPGAIDSEHRKRVAVNLFNQYLKYADKKKLDSRVVIESFVPDLNQRTLIEYISSDSGKPLDKLICDDFIEHYPLDDGNLSGDVFQNNLSVLFKGYHTRQEENQYDEFRYEKYNEGGFLSSEEFVQRHGTPPWKFVQRILDIAQLGYVLTTPEGTKKESVFAVELVDKITKAIVKFDDLSSGEKVLLSIAISFCNLNMKVEFPEVLLMDEPDGPLHPSMSKVFIDIVKKVFVEEKGVKVIMTTHSPSTVAVCSEESIYIMNKAEPRIEKGTKDMALSLLTSGVPSLSVSYENRRQVFVESKYDQRLLEHAHLKLSSWLTSDISLTFMCQDISGSSSCSEVKDIVKRLVDYGNPYVYGIVDWDLENEGEGNVKILGNKNRYSIENYVLDPLLIGVFLIRENIKESAYFGLPETDTYLDVHTYEVDKLQMIINKVIEDLQSHIGDRTIETETCELISDITVSIPRWLLHCNGHNLEDKLNIVYPSLQKYNKPCELKSTIMDKVVGDNPKLLSNDFIDLFKSLQV